VSGPRAGSRIEIVLVAAVADNGVIGRGGALPWRLKSDMLRLRALTWGKPIVVGRTTYLSFSKQPLPGRTNIVVSRNQNFAAPGALVASSLGAALEAARGDALRRAAEPRSTRKPWPSPIGWRSPACTLSRTAVRSFRPSIRRFGGKRNAASIAPGPTTKRASPRSLMNGARCWTPGRMVGANRERKAMRRRAARASAAL
jgi:hypothetical protein